MKTADELLIEANRLFSELHKKSVEFMKTPPTEEDKIIARLQGFRPAPSKAYWVKWL